METALITGGSGFLGKALVRHLKERGIRPIVFDESYPTGDVEHRYGSILDSVRVRMAVSDVDVVYHLAGLLGTTELMFQSASAVDVNIKGTVTVLEACRLAGVSRFFYPTKPNEWLNTYSITKRAGEEFARMYQHAYGMDVRIVRWLNAYGPGQKAWPIRKAVPLIVLQALYDLPIEVYGSGSQPVDLVYVDDLARVTASYMKIPSAAATSSTRDTGLTVRMTVLEMVEKIVELVGSSSMIKHVPMRLGEDDKKPVELLQSDTAAALCALNDPTDVVDGLKQTIEHYRDLAPRVVEAALRFHYGRVPMRGEDVFTISARQPYLS